ncbi:ACY1-like metalloprotease [Phytophthora cinnamomi]|uniref:ACY1-like metalloprotease n=1 Tax=Phytophthora cinnamomi TaxID=4785 RepID=UPI00355AB8A8|nr:ACY1-like metalloprotease [Phytophthora cinnamomi]
MKSVDVQYVEAVYRLKTAGFEPSRNIHLLFVPDEESGTGEGMEAFLASERLRGLPDTEVGFIENTATSKIVEICNKALAFRAEQEALLNAHAGCKHGDIKKRNLGDLTTVNLTILQSGVSQDGGKTHALNVIPTEAVTGFDVRISPSTDLKKFKAMLDEWCAPEGLSWEFVSW